MLRESLKNPLIIAIALNLVMNCEAQCGACGAASGVACLSSTSFRFCANNAVDPNSLIQTCQSGLLCGNIPSVCAASSATFTPDCPPTPPCGICDSTRRFGCISSTTYGLCFGSTIVSTTSTNSCPIGQFCDITATAPAFCTTNQQNACAPPITTTPVPTTTTLPPSTTLPSNPPTATQICNALYPTPGRYPSTIYTSCTGYLYCQLSRITGTMIGQDYSCPGSTLFNRTRQTCVSSVNFICT